jgi:hypothetical protein
MGSLIAGRDRTSTGVRNPPLFPRRRRRTAALRTGHISARLQRGGPRWQAVVQCRFGFKHCILRRSPIRELKSILEREGQRRSAVPDRRRPPHLNADIRHGVLYVIRHGGFHLAGACHYAHANGAFLSDSDARGGESRDQHAGKPETAKLAPAAKFRAARQHGAACASSTSAAAAAAGWAHVTEPQGLSDTEPTWPRDFKAAPLRPRGSWTGADPIRRRGHGACRRE